MVLFLIYTRYYPNRADADIFKYFDDSKVMYDALWTKPEDFFRMLFSIGNDSPHFDSTYYSKMNHWFRPFASNVYNDSHTIIRFNAALRILSGGSYHVHTIVMCFLSLIGLTALYRAFVPFVKAYSKLLIVGVFLIPTVMFWSSGVLKEGLLVFGLGLVVHHLFKLLRKEYSIWSIAVLLFCMALLLHLKFYVIVALLPGMLAFTWSSVTSEKFLWIKYGTVLAGCVLLALQVQHVYPDYDVLKLLVRKQKDFIGLVEAYPAGSALSVTPLEPTFWSLLKNSPEAFYHTYCRPFFWEVGNPLMLLAGVENFFIFVATILAIFFRKSTSSINWNLVLFCMMYVMILFILIGWTTVVMGAIVRYKLPALPFLAMTLLLITDRDKMNLWVQRLLPSQRHKA